MVDCRNCRHAYRIWNDGWFAEDEKYKLVCLVKEVFIGEEYITNGPCDLYVDVDGYVSGDGDL